MRKNETDDNSSEREQFRVHREPKAENLVLGTMHRVCVLSLIRLSNHRGQGSSFSVLVMIVDIICQTIWICKYKVKKTNRQKIIIDWNKNETMDFCHYFDFFRMKKHSFQKCIAAYAAVGIKYKPWSRLIDTVNFCVCSRCSVSNGICARHTARHRLDTYRFLEKNIWKHNKNLKEHRKNFLPAECMNDREKKNTTNSWSVFVESL